MKKSHITIKNNETGEITHDLDTDAIVGGILDDDGTFSLGLTHCNASGLLNAIKGAEKAIDQMFMNHPELLLLKLMAEKKTKEAEEATDETTEN